MPSCRFTPFPPLLKLHHHPSSSCHSLNHLSLSSFLPLALLSHQRASPHQNTTLPPPCLSIRKSRHQPNLTGKTACNPSPSPHSISGRSFSVSAPSCLLLLLLHQLPLPSSFLFLNSPLLSLSKLSSPISLLPIFFSQKKKENRKKLSSKPHSYFLMFRFKLNTFFPKVVALFLSFGPLESH